MKSVLVWIGSVSTKYTCPWHSANIQFLKPARVHEKIEVVSIIKAIRPVSLVFDQYLRLANNKDKILCKAEVKLACVDEAMQPRHLPAAPFLDLIRRILT